MYSFYYSSRLRFRLRFNSASSTSNDRLCDDKSAISSTKVNKNRRYSTFESIARYAVPNFTVNPRRHRLRLLGGGCGGLTSCTSDAGVGCCRKDGESGVSGDVGGGGSGSGGGDGGDVRVGGGGGGTRDGDRDGCDCGRWRLWRRHL